jgi:hypothetical protein
MPGGGWRWRDTPGRSWSAGTGAAFVSQTEAIMFVTKGTHKITGVVEVERLVSPHQQFKVTDIPKRRYVTLEKTSTQPTGNTRWI